MVVFILQSTSLNQSNQNVLKSIKRTRTNMTKYQVRSKELIDLVNEIKNRRLIISPYFQRNLVWRQIHKVDFIKTILLGYPFPQIFIAKGNIDLETMTTTSCIVDGQQRMSSIFEFIGDKYKVDDLYFSDFSPEVKEKFLKYQIPIIDLDIDNEDPEIIEIFQRLNRTFYALSTVEKLATEYASSEFMLFAKSMCKEIDFQDDDLIEFEVLPLQLDPNIPPSFIDWALQNKSKHFQKLILEKKIFTSYQLTRQVHLMFTLNVIATIFSDYFNRNDFTTRYLDEHAESFHEKEDIFIKLENSAKKILDLKLKEKSYWYNKANIFSLTCLFAKNPSILNIDSKEIKDKLSIFENDVPEEYRIAAKEGVNNKKERLIRESYLKALLE